MRKNHFWRNFLLNECNRMQVVIPYALAGFFYNLWTSEVKRNKTIFIRDQLRQIDRLRQQSQWTRSDNEIVTRYENWLQDKTKEWILFPLFFSIRNEAIIMKLMLSQEFNNDVLHDISTAT